MRPNDYRPALIAMVIGAVVLTAATLVISRPLAPSSMLGFWIAACVVSELLWVRLPLGNATLSMSSCFNLAMLLVLPRGDAMLAALISVAFAEVAFMHKSAARVAFNSCQTALAVGAGSLAFASLAGPDPSLGGLIAHLDFLPFVVAALAYSVVNTGAVALAVALAERTPIWHAWMENFGNAFELLIRAALFSLGVLVGVNFSLTGPAGMLLVGLPLVLARFAYARRLERLAESLRERARAA